MKKFKINKKKVTRNLMILLNIIVIGIIIYTIKTKGISLNIVLFLLSQNNLLY